MLQGPRHFKIDFTQKLYSQHVNYGSNLIRTFVLKSKYKVFFHLAGGGGPREMNVESRGTKVS